MFWLVLGLNIVDYFQTIYLLSFSHFREMNGFMSWLFSFPFPVWLSFGLVKFFFSFLLYRFWSFLSSLVKWVFLGLVFWVVCNNVLVSYGLHFF